METPTTSSSRHETPTNDTESLPVIDVSPLLADNPSEESLNRVVQDIRNACCDWGFFYITNHEISINLQKQAESVCREFFALPLEKKLEISIDNAGKSWRGYFSKGVEYTNKTADLKEGINFGVEHPPDHPNILAGLPLHGPNLWPSTVPDMKSVLSEYMQRLEKLGLGIMKGVALSLNLPPNYFQENYLYNSNYRLIALNYPPDVKTDEQGKPRWGVGEHSDYGLLTILKQDNSGGLQVKSVDQEWIEADPIKNTFVVNIGDMLQTITNGLYVSTPHRVQNIYTGKDRFSCPFFLDPSWDAVIKPLPSTFIDKQSAGVSDVERSQRVKSNSYTGKYGDYAVAKFSKNFPDAKKVHPARGGSSAFQFAARAFSMLRKFKL